jgi:hypothetical protein
MVGDNHRVPLVELALLSSMLAKAPMGSRCGDYSRKETTQWMVEPMGPDKLCAVFGLHRWHAGQRWTCVLSISIKPQFPSHYHHQKLACSGWSAREAGLSDVAAVALHSAIDVKCSRQLYLTSSSLTTKQNESVSHDEVPTMS